MSNDARNQEIIRLYTKGGQRFSLSTIAAQVGCTRNVVAGVLHRAGVADRNPAKAFNTPRPGNGGVNNAVLDEEAVREIRAEHRPRARGVVQKLAKRYGVSPTSIWRVVSGETWKHVA